MATSQVYNQIVLFGDSITQFGFNPEINGYAAILANAYQRKLDVINRGFSGYNTDWALSVLRQILPTKQAQQAQAASISLMTIFFGANDAAVPSSPQHVPIERFESNLHVMINLMKDPKSDYYNPGIRLILITPPPFNAKQWKDPNRDNELAKKYAQVVCKAGNEKGVPVVDLWTGITKKCEAGTRDISDFLLDGLHLNANGYQVLYDLLLQVIDSKYNEIHPDKLQFEIPDWRSLLEESDILGKLNFPLLLKKEPTNGN